MNVRLTTDLVGSGFALSAGEVIDRDELLRLIGDGVDRVSVPVRDVPTEIAVKPAPAETAARRIPHRRK